MFGKITYDRIQDAYLCELPVRREDGTLAICGKWCKDLVRHITRHHKMTARQYKKLLGIDLNEPLMSEDTRSKLRDAVNRYGTDRNLELDKPYLFKPGQVTVQKYKRSEQTKARLRTLRRTSRIKKVKV